MNDEIYRVMIYHNMEHEEIFFRYSTKVYTGHMAHIKFKFHNFDQKNNYFRVNRINEEI